VTKKTVIKPLLEQFPIGVYLINVLYSNSDFKSLSCAEGFRVRFWSKKIP
jgi:hypothetical protein